MNLQIQPLFSRREEWDSFALQNGLSYEVLELSMTPILNPEAEGLRRYLTWYRSRGLARSLHGVFIDVNPASGDPAFRQLSQERCRESCYMAKALGVQNVVFHGSAFPFLRGGFIDYWAGLCADFYTELAEETGLTFYIENSFDLDPEPLGLLLSRTDPEKVKACLDVGHANYSRTPVPAWFETLGPRIGYLHLSDNLGQFDEHLPLGRGNIDWSQVHRFWQELGDIPVTLEVGRLDGVKASVAYLRENSFFGLGGDTHGD